MSTHKKPHIIVGAVPAFGHFEKLKVIAADLVKRGYPVTFLAANVARAEIEAIGARFVPLKGRADFDFERRDEVYPFYESMSEGMERMVWEMDTWFIAPMKDQHECLQGLLKEMKETDGGDDRQVIYIDDIGFGAAAPALLGAPGCIRPKGVIKIGVCPLVQESVDTAPFGMGLPPDSSEAGRTRNLALREQVGFASAPVQKLWEDALRLTGVPEDEQRPWPRFLDGLARCCDIYLQMSIPEFEYPRSDLPAGLRFMGALPSVGTKEKNVKFPEWWDEIIHAPEGGRPIVVVTQGSASNNPDDLIIPTIEALKDLDVTLIVTLVRSDTLKTTGNNVPANVKLAQFIPFDILFQHTSILISNGGFGTVQQALFRGVPMVLAGISEDKPETNAHAAWVGAAINLACQRPEPSQVRDAVTQILADPGRKKRCLELKEEYAKYDALSIVAAAVDELATRKRDFTVITRAPYNRKAQARAA